jgi:hypothetical protein
VQEDTAVFDIHVLWDTPDLDVAMDAAFLHGQAFFGPNLTGGSVFATLNSAANGIRKRYGNLGWIVDAVLNLLRQTSVADGGLSDVVSG